MKKAMKFGMELLSFIGSLLWNNLNDEIKELPTVANFKQRSRHGWVKNVIEIFLNSLSITLCSLHIIFLDVIANYIVNSWY